MSEVTILLTAEVVVAAAVVPRSFRCPGDDGLLGHGADDSTIRFCSRTGYGYVELSSTSVQNRCIITSTSAGDL